jgi:hypothetical protein
MKNWKVGTKVFYDIFPMHADEPGTVMFDEYTKRIRIHQDKPEEGICEWVDLPATSDKDYEDKSNTLEDYDPVYDVRLKRAYKDKVKSMYDVMIPTPNGIKMTNLRK